jgi:hypothetical protein
LQGQRVLSGQTQSLDDELLRRRPLAHANCTIVLATSRPCPSLQAMRLCHTVGSPPDQDLRLSFEKLQTDRSIGNLPGTTAAWRTGTGQIETCVASACPGPMDGWHGREP